MIDLFQPNEEKFTPGLTLLQLISLTINLAQYVNTNLTHLCS